MCLHEFRRGERFTAGVRGDLIFLLGGLVRGDTGRTAAVRGGAGANLVLELLVGGGALETGELVGARVHVPEGGPVGGERAANGVVVIAEHAEPREPQARTRVGLHRAGEEIGHHGEPRILITI